MPEQRPPVQSKIRRPPPEPEPIEVAVLYEDEWLIAIDKPAGMIVHPTYKNWSRTLLNGLLYHLTGSEVIFGGQSRAGVCEDVRGDGVEPCVIFS